MMRPLLISSTTALLFILLTLKNVNTFTIHQPPFLKTTPHTTTTTTTTTSLSASALETLSQLTKLSIDSGSLSTIEQYSQSSNVITDATTNPLFISQMAQNPKNSSPDAVTYQSMINEAITYAKNANCNSEGCDDVDEVMNIAMDKLSVNLGVAISSLVPGRISTEVDVRLSHDIEASVQRALRLMDMYAECMDGGMNTAKERVLIKLAGTWEGIQAARILEKEHGIKCNITLVFSFLQAAAAAQAGVYLISPFPGRILDWYRSKNGGKYYEPSADPGVLAVKRMVGYFERYGYDTICMPASWRPSRGQDVEGSDVDEILELCGVDEMTIPPSLLDSLDKMDGSLVEKRCDKVMEGVVCNDPDFELNKESFEKYWKADRCGQDKLQEGIDAFTKDTETLSDILIDMFS